MILSRENLGNIGQDGPVKPVPGSFDLPEKVLQFGTGVLLRGLPDYLIDKANRLGMFNGRIVVVKSTGNGGTDEFAAQDNLYTHYLRGIENGARTEEAIINSSISRVLSAATEWQAILDCAASEQMQVIISNTTEVGIRLLPGDDVLGAPPKSFPGKLTGFLYARYLAFKGAPDKGLVIIPTELIPDNARVLKEICVKLAKETGLEDAFIQWLTEANDFCNSLVDCIVPGALPESEAGFQADAQGYEDKLHISSETYRLWAIESSSARTREVLSFRNADEGVIIAESIDRFRELKLRLLNGAHTFTCGLAVLSDFNTVREAMSNTFFEAFISELLLDEIGPSILGNGITKEEAVTFSRKVLDRFRNPFIEHRWQNICMQYTSKMSLRCVPVLLEYYRRKRQVPRHMAAGFGAYILYMNSARMATGQFVGKAWGKTYIIQDDQAERLFDHCNYATPEAAVHAVLSDVGLWGADLSKLPGFEVAVMNTVRKFLEQRAGAYASQTAILAA